MFKKLLKSKISIFLVLLIIFGAFLRFHNLSNLYIFGFDEEYQATYAMTLVADMHPVWIGVNASFLDYYLGPYFTYFTAFWLWLSRGDPLLTAYVAALVGVATSTVVFFVGWKFFNLTTGITSSLLYAGLPLIVIYNQKYWNPMFIPLVVLLMFITLMNIKKSPKFWLLYSAIVGIMLHIHLAPLPLVLIGVWYFIKGKYFLQKKLVLGCILVFMLFYWPLLIFDYNHNWSNLSAIGRYSEQARKAGAKFDPVTKFASFFETMGRFWYLEPGKPNTDELNIGCQKLRTIPPVWLSSASLILFSYFLFRGLTGKDKAYRLLSLFLLVSGISYLVFTGGSFEYYLTGFIALLAIMAGVVVGRIKKLKVIAYLIVAFILIIGVNTIISSSDSLSLGSKKRLIEKVMVKVGNNNFMITGTGICHSWEGWRYLFKAYGRTPAKSYTDANLGWLYPKELNNDPVIYDVILSESGTLSDKDMDGYDKIKEGGYTAYIKKLK